MPAFFGRPLDQAGVGSCVLVGHSMGTQFAVEAARQQPGRFTQLVLMGPVADSRRRTVSRQAFDRAVDCLLFESPASNLLVLADYFRCGPRWYLTGLPVMMSYPTEERIADVDAPVLVLRGPGILSPRGTGAAGWWAVRCPENSARYPDPVTSCSTPPPAKWRRPSGTSRQAPAGHWKARRDRRAAQGTLVGAGLCLRRGLAGPGRAFPDPGR